MSTNQFYVQTVLGRVAVSELGRTLTHEHLSADIAQPGVFYRTPPQQVAQLSNFDDSAINLDNVGLVRQYPYSNKFNLEFEDDATHTAVMDDLRTFKQVGGGCLVENTSHGIHRDLPFMVEASKATGVQIIAGSGFYVKETQSESQLSSSIEDLASVIRADLLEGCADFQQVKCGVVAEVGSGWPISDFEKRAIQATATVQAEVGCGVSFHPGRDAAAPEEIARIYLEAGGSRAKGVVSHLDRTLHTAEQLLSFAQLGLYCQFDLFGLETSLYQLNTQVAMPSDAQRVDKIACLVDDGRPDQILVSHDIHTKHRLTKFGGHGFAHILLNVVPMMQTKGISQENIDKILIGNPQTWLGVDPNYQSRNITIL